MMNKQKGLSVQCSVDFDEMEKGFDPETNQACYIAQGTAHFYIEEAGERIYTNGFANPVAYLDEQTNVLRIDGLTTCWVDEADDEEIDFTEEFEAFINQHEDTLCTQLASEPSVHEQLLQLIACRH